MVLQITVRETPQKDSDPSKWKAHNLHLHERYGLVIGHSCLSAHLSKITNNLGFASKYPSLLTLISRAIISLIIVYLYSSMSTKIFTQYSLYFFVRFGISHQCLLLELMTRFDKRQVTGPNQTLRGVWAPNITI